MPLAKRPNTLYADKVIAPLDVVAAIAATTTMPLQVMDGDYRIEGFKISVPGGYTQDPANYYAVTLQRGATVLATYSFLTGAQGTLATLVFGTGVLVANPTGVSGDRLDVVFTKNGTALNLPAQTRVVAHVKQITNV